MTERDALAMKIRWASRHSTTAEQARDAADAILADGYRKHCPESVGEVEVIGPETTRVGEVVSHRGFTYQRGGQVRITTAQERAHLKPGTIAVDDQGNAWKRGTGSWVSTGGDTPALYDDVDYPMTVLLEGRGE